MNEKASILIVDDEQRIRNVLSDILNVKGYDAYSVESGSKAIEILKNDHVDVILLDLVLPETNGLDLLGQFQKINDLIPIIMMSAYGSIPNAVEAIKKGAYDFIEKPVDADKLKIIIDNAIEKKVLSKENKFLREQLLDKYKIIGRSEHVKHLYEQVKKLAPLNCNVLITGESGTGKELIARSLHALSSRVSQNIVKVNCASIPNDLVESELFGHKKGSFTGAHQDQKGKIEAADKGTLFLDEIGELSLEVQAKLLQVLEDRKFYRIGDVKEIEVDVRLISATNKDLEKEIEKGTFREDLYYRINTTQIHIIPLRERKEDIPELIKYYLHTFLDENNIPTKDVSPSAVKPFLDYDWPGNIRELKNKIQELVIYHDGENIESEDVMLILNGNVAEQNLITTDFKSNLRTARENFEREYITNALTAHDWNVPATANYLGIERTNLYRKIKQLQIIQNHKD